MSQLRNDLCEWEWAETLDSENGNIISLLFCSSGFKIVVNLTGTKNDFFNLVRFKSTGVLVSDDRLEFGALSELVNSRTSSLKSEKFFRCYNDERFSEWQSHLGSQ